MNTQRTVIALLTQLRAAAAIACLTAIAGCAQHAATTAAPSGPGTMTPQVHHGSGTQQRELCH